MQEEGEEEEEANEGISVEAGGCDESKSNARRVRVCFGNFDILEILGKGSFGSVYRVVRHKDRRHYVMKKISWKTWMILNSVMR